MDLNKLESLLKTYKDSLSGGKGDKINIETIDKKQLMIGILVEKEHTDNVKIALEIALDHLEEDKEYYTKLIKSGIADEKDAIALYNKLYKKDIKEMKIEEKQLREIIREEILKEFKGFKKELSIVNHGKKYRLIGPIKEKELSDLSNKGFDSYQDAIDAMEKFGYKKFKG